MFYFCEFCSNRILLYFPMCVSVSVSHKSDISVGYPSTPWDPVGLPLDPWDPVGLPLDPLEYWRPTA